MAEGSNKEVTTGVLTEREASAKTFDDRMTARLHQETHLLKEFTQDMSLDPSTEPVTTAIAAGLFSPILVSGKLIDSADKAVVWAVRGLHRLFDHEALEGYAGKEAFRQSQAVSEEALRQSRVQAAADKLGQDRKHSDDVQLTREQRKSARGIELERRTVANADKRFGAGTVAPPSADLT